ASEVVDPRPYARGSIADVFKLYPNLGTLLPAMGYSSAQRKELRETIEAIECDIVIVATPIDLKGLLNLHKGTVNIRYEVEESEGTRLREYIEEFAKGATE
ncbi:MAG: GTPase, partial [Deltaproteobacteria bacterium]|nr:GTPase [Deltaproteobacteria bacterium]